MPPFRRVPRPVHRAVGLPSKHLPAAPAACQVGSALVILTVFSAGPFPIALTISYGNSSSHPLWPAQRGLSKLSGQPLTLGVFRFCQIYRDITSPPSQIPSPRPSGSPVLPKSCSCHDEYFTWRSVHLYVGCSSVVRPGKRAIGYI